MSSLYTLRAPGTRSEQWREPFVRFWGGLAKTAVRVHACRAVDIRCIYKHPTMRWAKSRWVFSASASFSRPPRYVHCLAEVKGLEESPNRPRTYLSAASSALPPPRPLAPSHCFFPFCRSRSCGALPAPSLLARGHDFSQYGNQPEARFRSVVHVPRDHPGEARRLRQRLQRLRKGADVVPSWDAASRLCLRSGRDCVGLLFYFYFVSLSLFLFPLVFVGKGDTVATSDPSSFRRVHSCSERIHLENGSLHFGCG